MYVYIARNAIIVVVASGVAAGLLMHNLRPFTLTGTIKGGLPQGSVPSFSFSSGNITHSEAQVFAVSTIRPFLKLSEDIARLVIKNI